MNIRRIVARIAAGSVAAVILLTGSLTAPAQADSGWGATRSVDTAKPLDSGWGPTVR